MSNIRSVILARLEDRIKDREFRVRYENWSSNPVTREVAEMLRDCLCRPAIIDLPCENLGDAAILAQGVSEGSFQFYDAMLNLRPLPRQQREPDLNYGAEPEKKKQPEKEESE